MDFCLWILCVVRRCVCLTSCICTYVAAYKKSYLSLIQGEREKKKAENNDTHTNRLGDKKTNSKRKVNCPRTHLVSERESDASSRLKEIIIIVLMFTHGGFTYVNRVDVLSAFGGHVASSTDGDRWRQMETDGGRCCQKQMLLSRPSIFKAHPPTIIIVSPSGT